MHSGMRVLRMQLGLSCTSGGPLDDFEAHFERFLPAMISLDHCIRQRHSDGHRTEWRFIAMLWTVQ